jgi:hypothetical protein
MQRPSAQLSSSNGFTGLDEAPTPLHHTNRTPTNNRNNPTDANNTNMHNQRDNTPNILIPIYSFHSIHWRYISIITYITGLELNEIFYKPAAFQNRMLHINKITY